MGRHGVNQVEVLEALLRRLRSELKLNERTCFEAMNPLDPPFLPKGGDFFITVGFDSSTFPVDFQIGGGAGQLVEQCSLTVAIFTRVKSDSADHSERILRDAERGLFAIKRKVLLALIDHDLLTLEGNPFLRQTLYATSCGRPSLLASERQPIALACLPLQFGVEYDWDLLAVEEEESSSSSVYSSPSSSSQSTSSDTSASTSSTTSLSSSSPSSESTTTTASSASSPSSQSTSSTFRLESSQSISLGEYPESKIVSGITDEMIEPFNGEYGFDLSMPNPYRQANTPQWSKNFDGTKFLIFYSNGDSYPPGWTLLWPNNLAFTRGLQADPDGEYLPIGFGVLSNPVVSSIDTSSPSSPSTTSTSPTSLSSPSTESSPSSPSTTTSTSPSSPSSASSASSPSSPSSPSTSTSLSTSTSFSSPSTQSSSSSTQLSYTTQAGGGGTESSSSSSTELLTTSTSESLPAGPTGGSWQINWGSGATAYLSYSATAAEVQAALENSINGLWGNVSVQELAAGPFPNLGGGYRITVNSVINAPLVSISNSLEGGQNVNITPAVVSGRNEIIGVEIHASDGGTYTIQTPLGETSPMAHYAPSLQYFADAIAAVTGWSVSASDGNPIVKLEVTNPANQDLPNCTLGSNNTDGTVDVTIQQEGSALEQTITLTFTT